MYMYIIYYMIYFIPTENIGKKIIPKSSKSTAVETIKLYNKLITLYII